MISFLYMQLLVHLPPSGLGTVLANGETGLHKPYHSDCPPTQLWATWEDCVFPEEHIFMPEATKGKQ